VRERAQSRRTCAPRMEERSCVAAPSSDRSSSRWIEIYRRKPRRGSTHFGCRGHGLSKRGTCSISSCCTSAAGSSTSGSPLRMAPATTGVALRSQWHETTPPVALSMARCEPHQTPELRAPAGGPVRPSPAKQSNAPHADAVQAARRAPRSGRSAWTAASTVRPCCLGMGLRPQLVSRTCVPIQRSPTAWDRPDARSRRFVARDSSAISASCHPTCNEACRWDRNATTGSCDSLTGWISQ
jgi:hypothetical protein